jgi:hypothetical protein
MSKSSTDSKRAELTELKKRAILEVYGNKCAITGLHSKKVHIDHIVSLFDGGSNEWNNLIPVLSHINLKKGKNRYDAPLESYLKMIAANKAVEVQRKYEQLSHRKMGLPYDPAKIDLENLHNILPTAKTGIWAKAERIYYLVREYVKRGVTALEKIAGELGVTLASVRAKLTHLGIYRREYIIP